jgi:hypothetical protein
MWGPRIALGSSIVVLFVRGRFFEETAEKTAIHPVRAAAALLTMGIGGTIAALAAVLFVGMSMDMRALDDLPWLLVPTVFLLVGASIIGLGAWLRRPHKRKS